MYHVKAPSPMLVTEKKIKASELKVGDMIEGKRIKSIKKASYPKGSILIQLEDDSSHLIINTKKKFGP